MNRKGFASVALIVLIVIFVGVAGYLMVTKSSSTNEKKNNKIIQSTTELRIQGEILYGENKSYKDLCSDGYINASDKNAGLSQVVNTILSAKGVSTEVEAGIQCSASDKNFTVSVLLLGGKHWCPRDSTLEGPGVKYCANGADNWSINSFGVAGLR